MSVTQSSSALVERVAPGPRGLTPVASSEGLVPPERLVRRLMAATDVSVALIVAPAGYGKTTLLEAWADADPRPFAWIDAGRRVIAPDALRAQAMAQIAAVAGGGPFVVVVEDVDALGGSATATALGSIADALHPGSLLALSSRREAPLPVGRLRAHRQVLELGMRDLAMTHREAAALLAEAGVDLDAHGVETVLDRTEGWPVALYLAALALSEQPDAAAAAASFSGDDRVVADYLRDQFLTEMPPGRLAFLTRTSLLNPLSGALCDAVLERNGSGEELRRLGRSEMLISAVDRGEEHFRYHPLFADMLRAELHRGQPDLEAQLHRRASAWYDDHGDQAAAIDHAMAGADLDRAGELLWRAATSAVWDGRIDALDAWLADVPSRQVERRPALALTAAMSCLAHGRCDSVDRWTAVAERHIDAAPARGRASLEAGVALMHAASARGGVEAMARNAARAAELAPEDSPWLSLCCLLAGTARGFTGDVDQGRADLEQGARHAAVVAPGIEALCLAQLALLALLDHDWGQGASLGGRARARVAGAHLEDLPTMGLVYAVSAFAAAHRGRLEEARRDAAAARRLLEDLEGVPPWYAAPASLALARAELRLSNVAEARGLIADAARITRRMPDAWVLRGWIEDAWARADTFAVESLSGPSSLTTAELRILRFLPSHLFFREIAERLNVSTNTVKTQAHAVYRKLDASSRSEAVARASQLGLLDGSDR
jgi:LuxR family transcriptional regulator, maltose regulon positive regulatory protein